MADNKKYALDMTTAEWREYLEKALQEPKFRADQIMQWLWQKHTDDPAEMTNLALPLREKLAEKVAFNYPELIREQKSADGTRKFLWKLRDGQTVESVLMKYGERLTACISTQVGCPLACTFCATGLSGFERNLSSGEIAGQVLAIEKKIGREVNNVVYMGMGEPFLNTENVLRSVRMLNDEKLRNLGIRHITISTSGIIPGIEALADSGLGVRLAVSLHAADDDVRSFLMPVNESYPTAPLRKALQAYQEKTGDRITIEYALFGGVNDSVEHARDLVRYLKGIHAFVNLIPGNSVEGRYPRSNAEDILRFKSVLQTAGFETELRSEQGADIDAACGQLRRKNSEGIAAPLEGHAYSVAHADLARENKPLERRAKPQETRSAASDRGSHGKTAGRAYENRAPRPAYGEKRERPAYGDKRERPAYGEKQQSRPAYGDKRERPAYGDKQQSRPAYGEKRERPAYGDKRERPAYGDKQQSRPAYGDKRERPAYGRQNENTAPEERTGFRSAAKPTGGFIAAAGKRRRDEKNPQDRYRSGKMKEARPSWRAGSEESQPGAERTRGSYGRDDSAPKKHQSKTGSNKGRGGAKPAGRRPAPKEGAFSKFYNAGKKGRKGK